MRANADAAKSAGLQLSAVSWAAILAGAATATVMSILLLILGTGLGLSVVSPWSAKGISAISLGITAIVWLTLTQLISSGLGGYIAGRLRTRWTHVDKAETYFRDTAHGFLSWAVSTLVTATVLASFVSSITGAGTQAAATVISGASIAGATVAHVGLTRSDADNLQNVYFLDSLFRMPSSASSVNGPRTGGERLNPESSASEQQSEVMHIMLNSLRTGPLPPDDLSHVAQIVAQRTGLTQQEAQQRVTDVYGRMQARFIAAQTTAIQAAEQARKASTYAALWMVVSMLVGAFMASWAAIFGGRQRDL
ncbi:hypothetical protein [Limnohabitans sp. DM1]|uniref:hypothetical protein n=1 Tax=Limnohabitans sp. DM1 TaxID=1597955 RepID=UPI000B7E9E16|nr:hypothetical protein [Limnohabitans sp. DM1]